MARILIILLLLISSQFVLAHKPQQIKRILLVMAMEKEAKPIIQIFHLCPAKINFKMPMHAYQGRYKNLDIFLILNGQDPVYKVQNVGTQPATLSTYLGIVTFHPDLVMSVGTAGGVKPKHVKAGELYLSKKIDFYSRRIPGKYQQYGYGNYSSYPMKPVPPFKVGTVCSGDAFDQSTCDYATFLKLNCDVIEMEAASVAWVSQLNHIPMIAVKGITNNVEAKNANAIYHKNFANVTNQLAKNLKKLFNQLSWNEVKCRH